jgi:hypothetical protein
MLQRTSSAKNPLKQVNDRRRSMKGLLLAGVPAR